MKAIILSAGQGSRLLPLTKSKPKCLLKVNDQHTVLSWQLTQLEAAGVKDVVIATGFENAMVAKEAENYGGNLTIKTLYNPFYSVADNLGTIWLIRDEMQSDEPFIILNGDTIFTSDVASALINSATAPITLTVAVKDKSETYDDDDMKVIRDESRLRRVSKKLSPEDANAESIGFMLFQNEGIEKFKNETMRIMNDRAGLKRFYLSVIDSLASEIEIGTVQVPMENWQEIDYPEDYTSARNAVQAWTAALPKTDSKSAI